MTLLYNNLKIIAILFAIYFFICYTVFVKFLRIFVNERNFT